nr:hypothetical protein SYMBAF_10060 [Serratia symbiotica]
MSLSLIYSTKPIIVGSYKVHLTLTHNLGREKNRNIAVAVSFKASQILSPSR